jgi:hypothetical protein
MVLCISSLGTAAAEESWTADWIFRAEPQGAVPLHPDQRVWCDRSRKIVMLDGEVCLRRGPLEMFACPQNTKEHESVVAVYASPQTVHAGLLAVGAESGSPVKFDSNQPATGAPIKVIVVWLDENGKRRSAPAQEWIQNAKTKKAMEFGWVFGGSGFARDDVTGRQHYLANGGDFICVSNSPTAMLDVPLSSSAENGSLLFQAFTERIPREKTKVRLVLIPGKIVTLTGDSK